ncbi:thioredoxin family protein [Pseudogracilibacillus sp. SO10305]
MRNKMILIIVVIVVLFAGLMLVTNMKNKQTIEDNNPYDKTNLQQSTVDLLDDPNYQNIIVPDDLDEKLDNKESVTVYYFSPTCSYCQKATPIVSPLAEDLDVDMKKLNLLEYDKMKHYEIEGTPTLIHYENGEEVARIEGLPENAEEVYEDFFETYVLN